MDSRGIEPRTTHMLSEYYTTKPQAHLYRTNSELCYITQTDNLNSAHRII